MGQPHHGGHQDVEGRLLLLDGVVEEAALEPESGVVDQQVDRPGLVGEPLLDQRHAGAGRTGRRRSTSLAAPWSRTSSSASVLQPLLVAGHQHEVVATLGETVARRRGRCRRWVR